MRGMKEEWKTNAKNVKKSRKRKMSDKKDGRRRWKEKTGDDVRETERELLRCAKK